MSPLLPRHRPFPFQPVLGIGFCLRLVTTGSASETWQLRGYFYVHVSYDLDSCSSALMRTLSMGFRRYRFQYPCHPRYMALALTMTGLPPVSKCCPSLGTQLPKPDPQGDPQGFLGTAKGEMEMTLLVCFTYFDTNDGRGRR
jgi:hypothetical protein